MILAFDTYYFENKAKTICVEFCNWADEKCHKIHSENLENIEEYISGEFYKRELPCILSLLEKIKQEIDNIELIIVDSFVYLDDDIELVKDYFNMEIVGETLDDAAGEAFDKTAKILDLPYPGGPLIDKYAKEGNPLTYKFPEPQIQGLNYSFSGFKTAILYFIRDNKIKNPQFVEENLADICASVQYSIVNILLNKLKKAAKQYNITEIAIAGGVSANSGLRNALLETQDTLGWNVYIPAFQYCTDNAGMIAIAGYHKYLAGEFVTQEISPMARMNF